MQRKKGSYALVTGDGNIEDRTLRDVLRGAGNQCIPLDKIVPLLIKTEEMVADILTKATAKEIFYKMRSYMLNSKESGDASALRARLLAQLAKLSR